MCCFLRQNSYSWPSWHLLLDATNHKKGMNILVAVKSFIYSSISTPTRTQWNLLNLETYKKHWQVKRRELRCNVTTMTILEEGCWCHFFQYKSISRRKGTYKIETPVLDFVICRVSSWSSPCPLLQMLNIGHNMGFLAIYLYHQCPLKIIDILCRICMLFISALLSRVKFQFHIMCLPEWLVCQDFFSTNLDQVCRLYAYSRDVTVLPWPVSMIRKWPPHLRSWSRSIIPNICKTLHFGMVMKTSDEDPKALRKKRFKTQDHPVHDLQRKTEKWNDKIVSSSTKKQLATFISQLNPLHSPSNDELLPFDVPSILWPLVFPSLSMNPSLSTDFSVGQLDRWWLAEHLDQKHSIETKLCSVSLFLGGEADFIDANEENANQKYKNYNKNLPHSSIFQKKSLESKLLSSFAALDLDIQPHEPNNFGILKSITSKITAEIPRIFQNWYQKCSHPHVRNA